jgi:oligopeptide transport system ATP-binding protein
MGTAPDILLTVRALRVAVPTRDGPVTVVDGIDLDVAAGNVSGIAGESGSGKTISMMAILGLLPTGSTVEGRATFRGQDILTYPAGHSSMRRGKDIALVMQDSHSSLHPMLSVGGQLTDHVRYHLRIGRREARNRAINLLRQVRIPDPEGAFNAYPHQFSGGMRQRIAIAIALACEPKILIADEPTTGLDVTVQAGILHLLDDLKERNRLAIILISHDLGVMSSLADNLTIMYAGRVVEAGPTQAVLTSPRHPYTRALLAALPQPKLHDLPLRPIPGYLGPASERPAGCAFHPRCIYAETRCTTVVPSLVDIGGRRHACLVDPFDGRT